MALTLDISPDMETLLRLTANKSGQDITGYLLKLVENDLDVDLSEFAGLGDYASSVAGIQAGLEDFNAGNSISFEDWCAKLETHLDEREKQQKVNAVYQEKAAR